MNKYFFLFWAFFSPLLAGAQAASRTQAKKLYQPQKIMLPPAATQVREQVNNWAEAASENPSSAETWVNYAIWTDRDPSLSPTQKSITLQQISAGAAKYIGTTGEWQLIRFLQSHKTDSAAIAQALENISDKTLAYPYAIQSAIIRQNTADLKKYCTAYAILNNFSLNNMVNQYHSNVLQSAPDSATIAALGENDLVPMAMLQQTHNIRTDVRLVYYQPGVERQYKNLLLCLTLGEPVLKQYTGAFRGLLLQISPANNMGTGENIVPAALSLNYLLNNTFGGELAQLHNNYLPGFILAWKYYRQNNQTSEANRFRQLIEKIAREGGKTSIISTLFPQ
ncbi:MAG: hypothetical protein JNM68_07795 [Dinghuibacter sp.]|nr:hypothetical protein [Dinghuibacter sp.]